MIPEGRACSTLSAPTSPTGHTENAGALSRALAHCSRVLDLDGWKLLRHRLGFRLLRPARRAVERDERAIARWVAEDWP
jgi:hypothetical protein